MDNNITESYCSFEVSKLLKEKGFDVYTIDTYNDSGQSTNRYSITIHDDMDEAELQKEFEVRNSEMVNDYISKPTHTLAIEWIRVNFGIWIGVSQDWTNGKLLGYESTIETVDGETTINLETVNTPQEATEAALLYALTKLISIFNGSHFRLSRFKF